VTRGLLSDLPHGQTLAQDTRRARPPAQDVGHHRVGTSHITNTGVDEGLRHVAGDAPYPLPSPTDGILSDLCLPPSLAAAWWVVRLLWHPGNNHVLSYPFPSPNSNLISKSLGSRRLGFVCLHVCRGPSTSRGRYWVLTTTQSIDKGSAGDAPLSICVWHWHRHGSRLDLLFLHGASSINGEGNLLPEHNIGGNRVRWIWFGDLCLSSPICVLGLALLGGTNHA